MVSQSAQVSVLWGFLVVTVVGFGAVAVPLVARYLGQPARKIFAGLVMFEVVLAALHIVFIGAETSFYGWLFNLNLELTAGAVFSTAQYGVIVLITLVNALGAPRLNFGQRAFWAALAVVFAWIATDEFLALHETVNTWRSAYMLAGGAVVVISLVSYALFFRGETALFVPFIVGLAIMGGAAVVLDVLTNDHALVVAGVEMKWLRLVACDAPWNPMPCGAVNQFAFMEEFLEMAGASLVLVSAANYFLKRQPASRTRLLRRLVAVSASTWLLLWASSFWVMPAVAGAMRSQPVHVDYLDGRLSLVGYEASKEVLLPGDSVTLSLYFRVNEPLHENYRLAVKLLPRYGQEVVAETDAQLGEWKYPTSAWIPGVTVRHNVRVTLPEGTSTPRSYWLTARVWHEEEPVEVAAATLEQSGPGTVVLRSLAVLSPEQPPAPAVVKEYRFADGPILAGYDVPDHAAPGEAVAITFWWRTESSVPLELNQFLHFVGSGGGEALFAHDQAPFGGDIFPTISWPAGMDEMTRWEVTLPSDLAPGSYDLYTGLYTLPDIVREPVVSSSGEPVRDNAIHLGRITIGEP